MCMCTIRVVRFLGNSKKKIVGSLECVAVYASSNIIRIDLELYQLTRFTLIQRHLLINLTPPYRTNAMNYKMFTTFV